MLITVKSLAGKIAQVALTIAGGGGLVVDSCLRAATSPLAMTAFWAQCNARSS